MAGLMMSWRRAGLFSPSFASHSLQKVNFNAVATASFSNQLWPGAVRHVTDWTCPKCGKNCFSSSKQCFNCQSPRYSTPRPSRTKPKKNETSSLRDKNQKPHERAEWYSKVIKSCGRDWKKALKILNEMDQEKGGKDIIAVNAAMRSCGKAGNWKETLELLESLKEDNKLKPNIVTINTVISTLAKSSEYEQAVNVFKSLNSSKWSNVKPNLITYNSIMLAYASSSKVDGMLALLNEMENNKLISVKPTLVTYSTIIKGCIHTGDSKVAMDMIEKISEQGIKLDINTINNTLKSFILKSEWKSAMDFFLCIFKKGEPSGLTPNIDSANVLLEVCKQSKRPREALLLLKHMIGPLPGHRFLVTSSPKEIEKIQIDDDEKEDESQHRLNITQEEDAMLKEVCNLLSSDIELNNQSFECVIDCLDENQFLEDAAQLMEIASRGSRFEFLNHSFVDEETTTSSNEKSIIKSDAVRGSGSSLSRQEIDNEDDEYDDEYDGEYDDEYDGVEDNHVEDNHDVSRNGRFGNVQTLTSPTIIEYDMFKDQIWLSNGSINLRGCSLSVSRATLACLVNDLRHEIRPPSDLFIFTESPKKADQILSILISSLNGPRNSLSMLKAKKANNNSSSTATTTKMSKKTKKNAATSTLTSSSAAVRHSEGSRVYIKQNDVERWLGTRWGRDYISPH